MIEAIMLRRKREYEAVQKDYNRMSKETTVDITKPEAELMLAGLGKLKITRKD